MVIKKINKALLESQDSLVCLDWLNFEAWSWKAEFDKTKKYFNLCQNGKGTTVYISNFGKIFTQKNVDLYSVIHIN